MAVTDAYASLDEYKERVTKTSDAADELIEAVLLAVSRHLDLECERFFGQDAAAVARLYDGNGGTRLYVADIATAIDLVVKADLDGDYAFDGDDETLTIGTHFWLGPANADKGPEPKPYRYLDIVPNNGRLSYWGRVATWPSYGLPSADEAYQLRAVEVTAKFGWSAVPGAIREATVMITRELLDLEAAGATQALQNIDAAVRLSPAAFSTIQRIKRDYGRAGSWFA